MTASNPLPTTAPPGTGEHLPTQRSSRRTTILLGLGTALILVVATWYMGGRQGFGQIGQGGVNTAVLPRIGQPAPDFFVMLTDGRLVRLSDFRGQPVWLNFWGSWCPPCRSEMPDMQAAYAQLQPQGLVMLAVALDEPMQAAADYAALNGATYLIGSDPYRQATGEGYPIVNFPTHILIDRAGIVRDVVLAPLATNEFLQRAQPILAQSAGP